MIIYITKYALTDGILEAEATISDNSPEMAVVRSKDYNIDQYFHKNEWFYELEQAISNSRNRQRKKLVSLKRQIEKLKRTDFKGTKPL